MPRPPRGGAGHSRSFYRFLATLLYQISQAKSLLSRLQAIFNLVQDFNIFFLDQAKKLDSLFSQVQLLMFKPVGAILPAPSGKRR